MLYTQYVNYCLPKQFLTLQTHWLRGDSGCEVNRTTTWTTRTAWPSRDGLSPAYLSTNGSTTTVTRRSSTSVRDRAGAAGSGPVCANWTHPRLCTRRSISYLRVQCKKSLSQEPVIANLKLLGQTVARRTGRQSWSNPGAEWQLYYTRAEWQLYYTRAEWQLYYTRAEWQLYNTRNRGYPN